MSKKWLVWMLIVLSLFVFASAQALSLTDGASSQDRFVQNPRRLSDIGDPYIIKAGDEYLTFATRSGVNFYVWRSTDLVKFKTQPALFGVDWASGNYWAPEVYERNGRYYMFFSATWKENLSMRIGVAVADAPEGPYEDALGGPLFDFGYAAIDASVLFDDDGIPYLFFSRDCSENIYNGNNESHVYGVQLSQDLLSTVGEPVMLTRPDASWEHSGDTFRWNEGPAVLKHDGKYYLFYSANYFGAKEYSVGVAVADHPLGPYTKQSNAPILSYVETPEAVIVSGPGHNSFFTVGDELFTAYHTHTQPYFPSGNRQLNIARAGFHADGTAYINGPTLAPQLKPLADIGLIDHIQSAVTDEQHALLADGDTCQTASSAAYVYTAKEACFTWPEPVTADMLMVYPALDQPVSGTVTVNGSLSAEFAYEANEKKPGGYALLTFEPTEITSLELVFNSKNGIGEVLLLGESK